jgi:hypothetical protein
MPSRPRTPDWPKWSILTELALREFVALSLGIDPSKVTTDTIAPGGYRESPEFRRRLNILDSEANVSFPVTASYGQSVDRRCPTRDLVSFATRVGWEMPAQLRDMGVSKRMALTPARAEYWIQKDLWSLREVGFLLCGWEPDETAPDAKELAAARDDVARAVLAGKLVEVGVPGRADVMYDRRMFRPADLIGWAGDRFPGFALFADLRPMDDVPLIDPDDEYYSEELDVAYMTWRAITKSRDKSSRPKVQALAWLRKHWPHLSDAARERIATVVSWDKTGGRPKRSRVSRTVTKKPR